MFNVDSVYCIGASHTDCQDFALHGEIDNISYGIISDGCSGSTLSEIGSRILVMALEESIKKVKDLDYYSIIAIWLNKLEDFIRILPSIGLDEHVLAATIGFFIIKDNKCLISLIGDGAISFKDKNGNISIDRIECEHNAPVYPYYLLKENYNLKIYKEQKKEFCTKLNGTCLNTDPIFGIPIYLKNFSNLNDFQNISICSDGIFSFSSAKSGSVEIDSIISQLLTIKSPAKFFLKRKWNFFKKIICPADTIVHDDDFSMVSILNLDEALK